MLKMLWNFGRTDKLLEKMVNEGMVQGAIKGAKISGIRIIGKAMRKAPVKTGLLRSSGSVHFDNENIFSTGSEGAGTQEATRKWQVVLGFNTSYAAEQDTRRDLPHPKGGQAGYMTDTFKAERTPTLKTIANEMKKEMKGIR